jgi:hypothetical protein
MTASPVPSFLRNASPASLRLGAAAAALLRQVESESATRPEAAGALAWLHAAAHACRAELA